MTRRIMLFLATAIAALSLMAGPASAAHEANNKLDLAATDPSWPSADGWGMSNFAAGNNGWQNQVRVDGLAPFNEYAWHGIGGGRDVVICTLVTNASGAGSCKGTENSFLGRTEVRDADTGAVVGSAVGSTDDDNMVEDGEIERRGSQRFHP